MKRLISILLVLVMVCCLLPATAFAEEVTSGTCGNHLTWTLENQTLTISGYGPMTNFEIGTQPWSGTITSIVIEDGVTRIGNYAFYYMQNVTNVSIPDSVTVIGMHAFGYCNRLTKLTIPETVVTIEPYAFEYCSALSTIAIPASVTLMGCGAFKGASKVNNVFFRGSAPAITEGSIGVFAGVSAKVYYPAGDLSWTKAVQESYSTGTSSPFKWYSYYSDHGTCGYDMTWTLDEAGTLTISGSGQMDDYGVILPGWIPGGRTVNHVMIEAFVKSIGNNAFYESTLTSIRIPDTVTSIGESAFALSNLESVVIPDSVTYIGLNAFSGSRIRKATLPATMTEIPGYMFQNCAQLASIEIPESVTTISRGAFYGTGLKRVTIPASVTSIDQGAFGNYNLEAGELVFLGDAPSIPADGAYGGFNYHHTDVYYPEGNETWNTLIESYVPSGDDTISWIPYGPEGPGGAEDTEQIPGDISGDGSIDSSDVSMLLWHFLFPDQQPISGNGDLNGDGEVDDADVALLLWHTLFPDQFPLN